MVKSQSRRVEAAVLSPVVVGVGFTVVAATGLLLSRFFIDWSRSDYAFLISSAALAYSLAAVRVTWRHRLPEWTFNVDVVIYIAIVSGLSIAASRHGFDLSRLLTWIALFVALYMPRRMVYVHVVLIGIALAVVDAYSTGIREPEATWALTFITIAGVAEIVSRLVAILRKSSAQDPLTRLANRRAWDDRLEEEIGRARRSGAALSILVIDIDDFKSVNDREGHSAGDSLLKAFAHGWRDVVRGSGDFLARLGGDEFGVLAPAADELGVRRLVARLADVAPGGATCSIGVATWDRSETAGDLFRRADEAMYTRKRALHSTRSSRADGPGEALQ